MPQSKSAAPRSRQVGTGVLCFPIGSELLWTRPSRGDRKQGLDNQVPSLSSLFQLRPHLCDEFCTSLCQEGSQCQCRFLEGVQGIL